MGQLSGLFCLLWSELGILKYFPLFILSNISKIIFSIFYQVNSKGPSLPSSRYNLNFPNYKMNKSR